MEQIILNRVDIEKIIAEKYNLNPQNGDEDIILIDKGFAKEYAKHIKHLDR